MRTTLRRSVTLPMRPFCPAAGRGRPGPTAARDTVPRGGRWTRSPPWCWPAGPGRRMRPPRQADAAGRRRRHAHAGARRGRRRVAAGRGRSTRQVPLPADVVVTAEEPPGGGPVAATAAAVALHRAVTADSALVALLAADLPLPRRTRSRRCVGGPATRPWTAPSWSTTPDAPSGCAGCGGSARCAPAGGARRPGRRAMRELVAACAWRARAPAGPATPPLVRLRH